MASKVALAQACQSFVSKQRRGQKRKFLFREHESKRHDEVILPFDDIKDSLQQHELVKMLRIGPKRVYVALKQLLFEESNEFEASHSERDVNETIGRLEPAVCTDCDSLNGVVLSHGFECILCNSVGTYGKPPSKGETGSSRQENGPPLQTAPTKCKNCGCADIVSDSKAAVHVCSHCGACQSGSFFVYSNPYRVLENKEDRRHFEVLAADHTDPWPLLEQFAAQVCIGLDNVGKARSLMASFSKRKRIAITDAACVAALIAVTCPDIVHTRSIENPKPPPTDFQCPVCFADVCSWMAARTHCTQMGVTARAKPLSMCKKSA